MIYQSSRYSHAVSVVEMAVRRSPFAIDSSRRTDVVHIQASAFPVFERIDPHWHSVYYRSLRGELAFQVQVYVPARRLEYLEQPCAGLPVQIVGLQHSVAILNNQSTQSPEYRQDWHLERVQHEQSRESL